MRILLYGSAFMTQLAEQALLAAGHDVVGHVPNKVCRFPGKMQSRPMPGFGDGGCYYFGPGEDIRISVLYDRLIRNGFEKTWNIHPGLLPEYGGCNTSFWALRNGEVEFGWTAHRVSEKFDKGDILTKVTFPIFPGDDPSLIFERHAFTLPSFAVHVVEMIQSFGHLQLPPQSRHIANGRKSMYYPASLMVDIQDYERRAYKWSGERIEEFVRRHNEQLQH